MAMGAVFEDPDARREWMHLSHEEARAIGGRMWNAETEWLRRDLAGVR
jgi:hypothetical protein